MQETGEIIRAVRQQLAAAEPDEEIEILALDPLDIAAARSLCQRGMRQSKRARVAAQLREAVEQRRIGGAREQRREQRILLRARRIDLVEVGRGLAIKIGPQRRAAHAGCSLDRQYALGGYVRPVRNRWLCNANFTGKRANAASHPDRLIESLIPHWRFSLLLQFDCRKVPPRRNGGQ
jgi:hypothetical protein